jgi:hypothetical protein
MTPDEMARAAGAVLVCALGLAALIAAFNDRNRL